VTVAVITGRATGTAYASNGQTATVTTIAYRDLCVAPCDIELPKGIQELRFYGGGAKTTPFKYDFKEGNTLTLKSSPRALNLAGLAAVLVGGGVAAIGVLGLNNIDNQGNVTNEPYAVPVIAGGAVIFAGGVGLYFLPRGKVTVGPPAAPAAGL
jgi:hypothetical protein